MQYLHVGRRPVCSCQWHSVFNITYSKDSLGKDIATFFDILNLQYKCRGFFLVFNVHVNLLISS